ncbi:hypothetical protein pb186bvf_016128 [Paramecium bursaria]
MNLRVFYKNKLIFLTLNQDNNKTLLYSNFIKNQINNNFKRIFTITNESITLSYKQFLIVKPFKQ